MFKRAFVTLLTGICMLAVLAPVYAVDIGIDKSGTGLVGDVADKSGYDIKNVSDTTVSETIGRIIKVVLSFLGTIFFVLMVYAGILWTTAGGNDEQVTKATSIIKSAVIGLIITMAAYGVTVFVLLATMSSATANAGTAPNSAWTFFKNNWARLLL